MSLKAVLSFIALVLFGIYFHSLNPDLLEVHLTRSDHLQIPPVVFLLTSVLVGVLLTAAFQSLLEIQASWTHFKENLKIKKQESRFRKWDKLFRKAENAIASGRRPKAVSLLEKILDENPSHMGALSQLGHHMRQEGKFDRAIELHRKATEVDPEDIKALHSLALDYQEAGFHDLRIQTLTQAHNLDPHSIPTLRQLRDAYLKSNKLDQAQTMQKSILPLIHDPAELQHEQELYTRILYSIGTRHLESGALDAAVTELRRAIRENPQSLPSYLLLGEAYLQVQQPKQALKIWKSGFELTRSPECLVRIEKLYDEMDKGKEADKLYREALTGSEPFEKEGLAVLFARRLLRAQNTQEALELLESLEKPSLAVRLLTFKLARDSQGTERAEPHVGSALEEAAGIVRQYHCSVCGKLADSWSAFCPSCNAWNSQIGATAGTSI